MQYTTADPRIFLAKDLTSIGYCPGRLRMADTTMSGIVRLSLESELIKASIVAAVIIFGSEDKTIFPALVIQSGMSSISAMNLGVLRGGIRGVSKRNEGSSEIDTRTFTIYEFDESALIPILVIHFRYHSLLSFSMYSIAQYSGYGPLPMRAFVARKLCSHSASNSPIANAREA